MNHIPSDLLRSFVAIVDSGSFSLAAEKVHRTQSAISMQIKKLEEMLGKTLFIRDRKELTLTADGRTLLGYARKILQLSEEALLLLKRPELSGSVEIGLPDDYAPRFLPRILARFSRTHPRVQVKVCCESSSQLMLKLHKGEIDLAIMSSMTPELEDATLLRTEPILWVYSPEHDILSQRPLPIAMFQGSCCWKQWAVSALEKAAIEYRIAYTSASLVGLQSAVQAGLAITLLSVSALPANLQQVPQDIGLPVLPQTSLMLYKNKNGQQPLIEALEQHIIAEFNSYRDQRQA